MPWTDEHLAWLTDTGTTVKTSCGKIAKVFELCYDLKNEEIMSNWAKHFRNHYCLDKDLNILKPPNITSAEFLTTLKFPHISKKPGPSIRSGDFAEILVADYLQYLREYYVPRTRYDRKTIGNESTKGSDVIGFKKTKKKASKKDELIVYEVKAKLSEKTKSNVLQNAILDSSKDEVRLAESLNGIKQRLFDQDIILGVNIVKRFQANVDQPYERKYGAAAVITKTSFCVKVLSESDTTDHKFRDKLELIIISGDQIMDLVSALYERAADEA